MSVFPDPQQLAQASTNPRVQAYQEILASASSGNEAIQDLLHRCKSFDSKFSLSYVCRKLGLNSKGYLSDVMRGRRFLGEKYWESLANFLQLDPAYREIFYLLLRIDAERDTHEQMLLKQELEIKRKAAGYSEKILSNKLRGMFFAFDVFCAFGLFKNSPGKDDLRTYFGVQRGLEIDVALNILLALDLIEKTADGRYGIKNYNIRFSDSEDGLSHLDFLKESMEDARRNVDRWREKRDESIFSSYIISVKRSQYLKVVDQLRRNLLEIQSNLESDDADMLVRFNIQVFPT